MGKTRHCTNNVRTPRQTYRPRELSPARSFYHRRCDWAFLELTNVDLSAQGIAFWKTVAEISAHAASVVAAIAAGYWFISNTIKQRVQFDIDCAFIPIRENPSELVVELRFVLENKGFVEHRLYNLNVSVHTSELGQDLKEKDATKELEFSKTLLPEVQLVPDKYGYYFVRPGVRQIITHIIRVPSGLSIVRVTSCFYYDREKNYPHTARRVFQTPALADARSPTTQTPFKGTGT